MGLFTSVVFICVEDLDHYIVQTHTDWAKYSYWYRNNSKKYHLINTSRVILCPYYFHVVYYAHQTTNNNKTRYYFSNHYFRIQKTIFKAEYHGYTALVLLLHERCAPKSIYLIHNSAI